MGRFSEPALLILESLSDGEKHGYGMMEDIKRRQGIDLGPGTLYGAISRLEDAGLIASLPMEERRRPYRLTSSGRAALAEQLRSLQRFAAVGLERLAPA
ncbi:MAG: PadR family transcriptional regulator [Chloroflexi bacterium]|nr:MAG: PadR family transcriptional regulator [Chloroflexota bacterium]